MSDTVNRVAYLRSLDQFKREWEAGRKPVIVPRAQYESYEKAAKAVHAWHHREPGYISRFAAEAGLDQAAAALRAAGLDTEEKIK